MLMKDEKELLTRKTVFEKLVRDSKRFIISVLIQLAVYLLFCGIAYLSLTAIFSGAYIVAIVIECLLLVPAIEFLYLIIRELLRIKRATDGEFTISEDCLQKVETAKPNLWRIFLRGRLLSKINFDHVFEFRSGKKFVANCAEHRNTRINAAASFSAPGDLFYVVCFNNSPNTIVWIYSAQTHKYKDN